MLKDNYIVTNVFFPTSSCYSYCQYTKSLKMKGIENTSLGLENDKIFKFLHLQKLVSKIAKFLR